MNLAIKGHQKKGKKVIEILEMLGGKNSYDAKGDCINLLYILCDGKIQYMQYTDAKTSVMNIFTLEEFLEKFPYKVGDKVQYKGATSCGSIFEVEEMRWEENTVKYTLCLFGCNYKHSTLPAEYLQPYKEETMEEDKKAKKYCTEESEDSGKTKKIAWFTFWDNDFADEVELYLEDRELVQKDSKWFIVKKKKKYPKTYEECYNILSEFNFTNPEKYDFEFDWRCTIKNKYYGKLMQSFVKLLICRDAYWKIAGEEMGLGKHWEPTTETVYCISRNDNVIKCSYRGGKSNILEFPTPEMRDKFYENFKDLIEQCKELL